MAEPKMHVYDSTTLGLPALRMVLVHARNDAQNAAARSHGVPVDANPVEDEALDKEQAIRKIIERLEELD